MRTWRLRFTGSLGWLWVIAILSLPLACAPAFLYLVYNFQVEATEGPSAAP